MESTTRILIPLHAQRGLGSFGVHLEDGQLTFPKLVTETEISFVPMVGDLEKSLASFGKFAGMRTIGTLDHNGEQVPVCIAIMSSTGETTESRWFSEGKLNSLIYNGGFKESSSLAAYSLFLLKRAEFGSLLTA